MSDELAAYLAKSATPPSGRVHLHAFVKRNSLTRCAVYEDGTSEPAKYLRTFVTPVKTVLDGQLDWRVSTRASSVCNVPGRCVMADIVADEGRRDA